MDPWRDMMDAINLDDLGIIVSTPGELDEAVPPKMTPENNQPPADPHTAEIKSSAEGATSKPRRAA